MFSRKSRLYNFLIIVNQIPLRMKTTIANLLSVEGLKIDHAFYEMDKAVNF